MKRTIHTKPKNKYETRLRAIEHNKNEIKDLITKRKNKNYGND